jgi:hypothetical protein
VCQSVGSEPRTAISNSCHSRILVADAPRIIIITITTWNTDTRVYDGWDLSYSFSACATAINWENIAAYKTGNTDQSFHLRLGNTSQKGSHGTQDHSLV